MRETNTGRQAIGHSSNTTSKRANRRPFSGNLIEPMEPRTLLSGGFYETIASVSASTISDAGLTPAGDVVYISDWNTVHKINASGQEVWSQPTGFRVSSLVTGSDGSAWVYGRNDVYEENWIARYRPDGSLAFSTLVVQGEGSIRSIAVNNSNQLVVLGQSTGRATLGTGGPKLPKSYYLMTLAPDGSIVHLTTVGGSSTSVSFFSMAIGSDDSIVLTGLGSSSVPGNGFLGVVRKLSPDGQFLWETELDDTGAGTSLTTPAVDGSGNIYVGQRAFRSPGASYTRECITKLSPAGSPIWSRSYGLFSGEFDTWDLVAGADGTFATRIVLRVDPFSHPTPASPAIPLANTATYQMQDLLCNADGEVIWTRLAYDRETPWYFAGIDAQDHLVEFAGSGSQRSLIRSQSPVQNGVLTVHTGSGDQAVRLVDDAGVLYTVIADITPYASSSPSANIFGVATSSVAGIELSLGDGNDTAIIDADIPATIRGGLGNDTIAGSFAADYIRGGQGNDVLDGRAGDDLIDGCDGDDLIRGRAGNDILLGDIGRDSVYGNAGDDVIILGGGSWQFGSGGPGADRIYVSDLQAVVMAIDEDDTVYGMRSPLM